MKENIYRLFSENTTTDEEKRKIQADFLYPGLYSFYNNNRFYRAYYNWQNGLKTKTKEFLIYRYKTMLNDFINTINIHIFGKHTILNIDKDTQNWVDIYKFNSRMSEKDLNLLKIKSSFGLAAWVLLPDFVQNKVFTNSLEIIGYPKYDNDKLIEVYLTQNQPFAMDNNLINCYHFYFDQNNNVILENILTNKQDLINYRNSSRTDYNKWNKASLPIINKYLNLDFIPVILVPNNEDSDPDWLKVEQLLIDYAELETEVIREWHFTKWRQLNNNIINPDKTAKQLENDIVNDVPGIRFIENENDESLMGQDDFRYLSNGSLTVDIVQTAADRKRDSLLKIALQINNIGGRNNKMTTEVIGNNIHAFNYLDSKKSLFQESYQRFYLMLFKLTKLYKFKGHELINIPNNELIQVELRLKPSTEILMGLMQKSEEKGNKESLESEKENNEFN